jgi:hypothetical protein
MRRGNVRHMRGARIIIAVAALLALFAVGYAYNGLLTSTRESERLLSVQRNGVEYIRPLTTLLASLVDAQRAAVRLESVPADNIRDAVKQIDGIQREIERESGDRLDIRLAWSQLHGEVENVVNRKVSGPSAMPAYAVPIGLTQALLGRIGDTSMMVRDPRADAHYLIDTVLVQVPEVIVSAGEVTGLAGSRTGDARFVVALDRISRTAEAVSAGPRSQTAQAGNGPATMSLLEPLDEFTAATDGLVQAASVSDLSDVRRLAGLDLALGRLQQAALRLDGAALDALEASLDARLGQLGTQQRNTIVAGVMFIVAVGVLLWWLWPSLVAATRPPPSTPLEPSRPLDDSIGVEEELVGVGDPAHALRPRGTR